MSRNRAPIVSLSATITKGIDGRTKETGRGKKGAAVGRRGGKVIFEASERRITSKSVMGRGIDSMDPRCSASLCAPRSGVRAQSVIATKTNDTTAGSLCALITALAGPQRYFEKSARPVLFRSRVVVVIESRDADAPES